MTGASAGGSHRDRAKFLPCIPAVNRCAVRLFGPATYGRTRFGVRGRDVRRHIHQRNERRGLRVPIRPVDRQVGAAGIGGRDARTVVSGTPPQRGLPLCGERDGRLRQRRKRVRCIVRNRFRVGTAGEAKRGLFARRLALSPERRFERENADRGQLQGWQRRFLSDQRRRNTGSGRFVRSACR